MVDPGWFPDPSDPELLRYWDGAAWGDETRPRPHDEPVAPEVGPWVPPWGAGAAAAPAGPATHPHPPPQPTGRRRAGASPQPRPAWAKALFAVVAVAVLAGAAFGGWKVYDAAQHDDDFSRPGVIDVDGPDDGAAPTDAVVAALGRHGVTCAEPGPPIGRNDLQQAVSLAAALAAGAPDTDAAGASVRAALAAATKRIARLPDADGYVVRSCGAAILVGTGSTTRLGLFIGARTTAVAAAAEAGLRLVSVAAPSMSSMVDLVEGAGETCPGAARTTSKQVLLAELLPRLQAGGDAAAVAERAALERLPDADVVVRNCTNTRLIGVDAAAHIALLGAGATLGADAFHKDGPLTVIPV